MIRNTNIPPYTSGDELPSSDNENNNINPSPTNSNLTTPVPSPNISSGNQTYPALPLLHGHQTPLPKKKVPSILLEIGRVNPDGKQVMEAILKHAIDDTWEKAFAHGKQIRWLESTCEHIFKPDETLNMFEPVVPSKFKRLFAAARKLLDQFTVHNHSFTDAEDGESFPKHLRSLINCWIKLKSGAIDQAGTKTQSQINRSVQDNIIGERLPLGNISVATARGSTMAENKRLGVPIAERGKNMPGALIDINDSNSDGSNDSGNNNAKKRKTSKGGTDVKGILEKNASTKNAMLSALNGLAATLDPAKKKVSDREFDLKDRALDHAKAIDSKKIELQQNKMEFEKLRWEENKNKELKKNARIQLLKVDYENAMDTARSRYETNVYADSKRFVPEVLGPSEEGMQ